MEYHWYDFVGNIGVFLILLAYLLLQISVLKSESLNFSFLNLSGALLILVSLYFEFNLSAFLVEFFWLIISMIGILKSWKLKK
jgi:hypothetical protein